MDKLKPKKPESPKHVYEQGRLYGILLERQRILKLINEKVPLLEKERDRIYKKYFPLKHTPRLEASIETLEALREVIEECVVEGEVAP